jgi:hypothetical protein
MTATKTITYPPDFCASPEHVSSTQLGGRPAVVRAFNCRGEDPKAVAVQILTLNGGNGYLAMCASPHGKAGGLPEFETACEQLLQGFRFLSVG